MVLKDVEWRCGIKTFVNQTGSGGRRIDAGQQILDALEDDPSGIALSNPHYASQGVKAVALTATPGGPPIAPTRETVASGSYPMARAVYIFFRESSGQVADSRVREFLRYVLSGAGQRDVAREGAYLPLPERVRQEQLKLIH